MRSVFTLAILFLFFIDIDQAQTPNWLWAKTPVGSGQDGGTAISSIANGSVYMTGQYSDTAVFGIDTLISIGGSENLFIAKYDALGNVIWAKSSAGIGFRFVYGVNADPEGNVFITGYYQYPSIVFGADTLTSIYGGIKNIFVVKYDSSGNVVWAKSVAGPNSAVGQGISTDPNGDAYITGLFVNDIVLGNDTLTTVVGNNAAFTVKYDPSGNVLWAKTIGGTGQSYGTSISTEANGNSYVMGGFNDTIIVGADTLMNGDIFVVKYDPSGNVLWSKAAGGSINNTSGNSISTDANGNTYMTGVFADTAVFGLDTLTSIGVNGNVFVVKYDPSGNVIWTKKASGMTNLSYGWSISTDINNNIYITGLFDSSTLIFGVDTLTNIDRSGEYNIFVAKYDSSGNVIGATSPIGVGYGFGISTDGNGNAYLTGNFSSPAIYFGADTLTNLGSGTNATNIFVAKIGNITTSISTIDPPNSMTIYPNPSNGSFIFSGVQTGSSIEVYDMLGEVVYSGQTKADIYPVSLSGQAKGMYFYTVRSISGAVQQGKMILE